MNTNKDIEPWKVISSTYTYQDQWLKLRSDTVLLPTGQVLSPYHAIECPDWVNVIAIDADECIILIEQYRVVVQQTMLEIPAGIVDPGESPLVAAQRELLEETGYAGGDWHELGVVFPASSRLTNKAWGYLALGVHQAVQPKPEASEILRIRRRPWTAFAAGLRSGEMNILEANQLTSIFRLHLLAVSSSNPAIARLRI